MRLAAESLRLVLGDEEVEATALAAVMRFSRRQRKMEVDEDLDAGRELEMQEERAAQQRWAYLDLFWCLSGELKKSLLCNYEGLVKGNRGPAGFKYRYLPSCMRGGF